MTQHGGCLYLTGGNDPQRKGGNLRHPNYSAVASYAYLT
jgi:hypothetical protein